MALADADFRVFRKARSEVRSLSWVMPAIWRPAHRMAMLTIASLLLTNN
jgi:hypothetical protein